MSILKKIQRFLPLTFRRLEPAVLTDLGALVTLPEGYYPTNPSIVDLPAGRLLYIRGVNYRMADSVTMRPIFTTGDYYHSVARFLLIEADGAIRTLPGLDAAFDDAEDVRLFEHLGEPWCVLSQPIPSGGCRMALARLDLAGERAEVTPLASPFTFKQEKNWSPFSYGGAIHLVYCFDPLVILRVDPLTLAAKVLRPEMAAIDPARFTFLLGGSGGGIEWDGDMLFVVHRRSVRLPGMNKIYVHRCARLAGSLDRVRFGRYFTIGTPDIQFVAGFSTRDGGYELSFGERDNVARLARFDAGAFARAVVPPNPRPA